jgi:hypothetical protein
MQSRPLPTRPVLITVTPTARSMRWPQTFPELGPLPLASSVGTVAGSAWGSSERNTFCRSAFEQPPWGTTLNSKGRVETAQAMLLGGGTRT